jgi:hypothetical protein
MKYSEKAKKLFTDTDSLCYHIQTPDVHADMGQLAATSIPTTTPRSTH